MVEKNCCLQNPHQLKYQPIFQSLVFATYYIPIILVWLQRVPGQDRLRESAAAERGEDKCAHHQPGRRLRGG